MTMMVKIEGMVVSMADYDDHDDDDDGEDDNDGPDRGDDDKHGGGLGERPGPDDGGAGGGRC